MDTTDRESERPAPHRRWVVSLLVALAAVALSVWLLRDRFEPRRDLSEMAPAERAELYRTTLSAFQEECVARRPLELERCESDAAFLLLFPECDGGCRQRVDDFLPRPSK